ncbi:glycoside hydrolase family 13 protein [Cryobacterium zhongshanensis]|uniref:Glycoside hydrolase family 13 protein n=1 Tax=Cryobacterium zhongshanensis TaxID=2928153 RepID=A0AA41QS06_9MICO|nr:glycoside hydrolase family 13 protein [Cryobacterium zhongshanensis]MCI4656265.1 glycoside hydrolase family 13 protein [Cryobacterium zhongshanensis]
MRPQSYAELYAEPHHDGSPLYVSTQTPALGDRVRVRVRVPRQFGTVVAVYARSNPDREPRFSPARLLGTVDDAQWWEAEVLVENPVHGYRFLLTLGDGGHAWLNASGVHSIETLDSEDFKLVTYAPPPEWARSTVMYQVFPDRFGRSAAADEREAPAWAIPADWSDDVDRDQPGRSHQFFGGDLDGVIEHLDHLIRLGVTLLYLTPVFPGASNHRYDAASFTEVDPLLGGNEALVRLVGAAHARGLRVIGDLTTNHSGDRHEWFRAAHRTPKAPESAFYYWLDDEQQDYASWLGARSLPKFNWASAELRRRFIEGPDSVVAHWLEPPYSLDGWRIDVANMTGRMLGDDLNAEVRQTIRRTMIDVNPDTILLGESTNDAASDFQGDAWHGAMTYTHFTRPLWGWLSKPNSPSSFFGLPYGTIPQYTGPQFFEAHRRFAAGFPWRTRLATMNALDTHDTPRFRTHALYGTVPVAFGLSVTLPGIPVVFAGDEFGLMGDDGEHSRTPMPWASTGEPAVAETIDLYAALIHLRTGHPALNGGSMRWLHVDDDVLVFVRETADESVLVLAARASGAVSLPAGTLAGAVAAARLIGDAELIGAAAGIRLEAPGPSFTAWALPGVLVPVG